MQLRKILVPVLAVALLVGFASTAAAQVTCTVASTPVSRGTATGLTEPVGDISFTCTAGGAVDVTTATLTIDLGLPITSDETYPDPAGVSLTGTETGIFAGMDDGVVNIHSIDHASGNILIELPGVTAPTANTVDSFTLSGVLVSLVGAGDDLDADISMSPADNYFITAGQNTTRIINKILTGLEDIEAGETATIFADGTVLAADSDLSIDVTEAYIDMLRWWSQFNTGNATTEQGTQVILTFAGIPEGLTIGSCDDSDQDGFDADVDGQLGLDRTSVTSTDNSLVVTMVTSDLAAITSFEVTCDDITFDADHVPFATGDITVSASLEPDGEDLDGTTVFEDEDGDEVPRYNQSFGNSVTVASIVPATSTLLVPFATAVGNFDTGLSVANTTSDPFGDDGVGDQDGTITFWLFPTDGDMMMWETSDNGEVGQGSDDYGVVIAGNTYTVNVSEIVADIVDADPDFNGYIFIESQFTNAHGQAFITDYAGFASAANVLVLPNPVGTARGTDETLGN